MNPVIARLDEMNDGVRVVVEDDRNSITINISYSSMTNPEVAVEFYERIVDQINGVGEKPTAVVERKVYLKYRWNDLIAIMFLGVLLWTIVGMIVRGIFGHG